MYFQRMKRIEHSRPGVKYTGSSLFLNRSYLYLFITDNGAGIYMNIYLMVVSSHSINIMFSFQDTII